MPPERLPHTSASDLFWAGLSGGIVGLLAVTPAIVFDLPFWAVLPAGIAVGFALRPLYHRFAVWRGWLNE